MWYQGQMAVLATQKPVVFSAPPQSALTYTAGVMTLGGAYYITQKTLAIAFLPCEKLVSNQRVELKGNYVPPQSLKELFQKAGKPALVRLGAASLAFFCSGAVQTHLALK